MNLISKLKLYLKTRSTHALTDGDIFGILMAALIIMITVVLMFANEIDKYNI